MSQSKPLHFRLCLASPGGFEPLTPRLGGECSIQLSYEDMSDFWLKIRAFWHFLSFRIGSRLFNYLCFLDELLHPTFLDTFAFGGKLYNTYFDRFELSSSFSYSSKASLGGECSIQLSYEDICYFQLIYYTISFFF